MTEEEKNSKKPTMHETFAIADEAVSSVFKQTLVQWVIIAGVAVALGWSLTTLGGLNKAQAQTTYQSESTARDLGLHLTKDTAEKTAIFNALEDIRKRQQISDDERRLDNRALYEYMRTQKRQHRLEKDAGDE